MKKLVMKLGLLVALSGVYAYASVASVSAGAKVACCSGGGGTCCGGTCSANGSGCSAQ